MGSCTESDFEHNDYFVKTQETWVLRFVGHLHFIKPIFLRTAVYVTRTYGGVRGALRQVIWRSRLLDYVFALPSSL